MRNKVLISNFDTLITRHGSQEALALAIEIEGVNQRRISDIRLGRRTLTEDQMREIEKKCLIPAGWLDRYEIKGKGFIAIMKYKELDEETRSVFDRLSLHMICAERSGEKI